MGVEKKKQELLMRKGENIKIKIKRVSNSEG